MEFSTTSNPLTSSQLPSGGLLAAAAPTPMRMSMEDDARTPLERLAATSLKTEEELVAMSDEDLLLLMHEANLGVVAKNKAMETVTELRNKAAADAAGDDEPPGRSGTQPNLFHVCTQNDDHMMLHAHGMKQQRAAKAAAREGCTADVNAHIETHRWSAAQTIVEGGTGRQEQKR